MIATSQTHRSQRGMTLLEIMIVLAIVAFLMIALVGSGMLASTTTRLRQDAVRVLATLRAARHLAMSTGLQHRVVFDLEEQKFFIETCETPVAQRRTDEEQTVDQEKLAELMERPVTSDFNQEILEAASPEEALAAAAALAGVQIGSARCALTKSDSGMADTLKVEFEVENKDRGIRIERIDVQHLTEPVTDSIVTINFFPLGSAEKAIVHLTNEDDDAYSVLVHGVTGRVEFKVGTVKAEDHMLRNGIGEDEDEREEK